MRTRTPTNPVASHVYRLLRGGVTPGRAELEALRGLLTKRRHRTVSIIEAQRFYDRAADRWRSEAAARSVRHRGRKAEAGLCKRCKVRPARPDRTNCQECADNAKQAVKDSREAKKAETRA